MPEFRGGATLGLLSGFNPCKIFKKMYNSDMKHHYKRFGFTLAEVLITLGIIGIVAALTIPAVISNYKKKVIEVGMEKTYSDLTNLIKMSEVNNGSFIDWDYTLDSKSFITK